MLTDLPRPAGDGLSTEVGIFIVSSHPLVSAAFGHLIEADGITVVGFGTTLADFLSLPLVRAEETTLLVGLLNTEREVQPALRLIQEIRGRCSRIKFIIVTEVLAPSVLRLVEQAGVEAALTMDVSTNVLQRTIDLVLLGQRVFPAGVAPYLAADGSGMDVGSDQPTVAGEARQGAPRSVARLSKRECEVLHLLETGCSNKAIARALGRSELTVKIHVKNVLRKMNAENRTQAAIWRFAATSRADEVATQDIGQQLEDTSV